MTFDLSFYKHLLVLVGIIIALTLFKIANLRPFNAEGEDFDWKKLLLGLGGNGLVLIGLALVYFLGDTFGSDVAAITFGDTTVTIHAALDVFMLATIGVYGSKLLENFKEYFGIGSVESHEIPLPPLPLAGAEEVEEEDFGDEELIQDTFNTDLMVEDGPEGDIVEEEDLLG